MKKESLEKRKELLKIVDLLPESVLERVKYIISGFMLYHENAEKEWFRKSIKKGEMKMEAKILLEMLISMVNESTTLAEAKRAAQMMEKARKDNELKEYEKRRLELIKIAN